MAVTAKLFGLVYKSAFNKEIDLDSDTIKVMLCTATFVPNQDTMQYKSSVTNEVANGGGYATGGKALTGITLVYDAPTNTFTLDCDDVTWANSSITARYAVFYDDAPATDATKPLLAYWDLGTNEVSASGNFTLTMSASGVITFTAA